MWASDITSARSREKTQYYTSAVINGEKWELESNGRQPIQAKVSLL